jgi:transposase
MTMAKESAACTPSERDLIARVEGASQEVSAARADALEFRQLLRERSQSGLAAWIDRVSAGAVMELRAFARSLMQDREAVMAAATLSWSNGPTEGAINRLKAIRRAMYGRGNLDLLRRRVLLGL